jgi:acetylornithine/succinyldiaminopimelate/putrescine aminotransferase
MDSRSLLFKTCEEILEKRLPNFLRLYISPYVTHTCLCLSRYVQETWYPNDAPLPDFQSFLSNSFEEALSGAVKLARFCADLEGQPKLGLLLSPEEEVGNLIFAELEGLGRIHFIPDVQVVRQNEFRTVAPQLDQSIGFVILFPSADLDALKLRERIESLGRQIPPRIIACVDRTSLDYCREEAPLSWRALRPDIVVFDESFVRRDVPFGAFTAHKSLFQPWNRKGFTTFHSTTFQPNTIASLHFLSCLEQDDPLFFAQMAKELERLRYDLAFRKSLFARLYNPSLARATAAVGWDRRELRASGHYIQVQQRQVFDAVGGVACSIRGHNPPHFLEELQGLADASDPHQLAAERLGERTGLRNLVPAVSGASAVEHALRLGLVAQYPKTHVLAFCGGFGGKTLLALTGTARSTYKRHIEPLYPHVVYVDPFQDHVLEDLEAALRAYPIGVVQLELVQGVGGVRALPQQVVHYLQKNRERWGYLLLVDEVQTGMYRTGPLLRSQALGLEPDLLTMGKGVSDMMVPFSATLYNDRVWQLLQARGSSLPDFLRQRYGYELGYKTLINVLEQAQKAGLSMHVHECGKLFERLLRNGLASCKAVREIRVFGLLLAIELDIRSWPRRWFRKQAGSVYVLNLLEHHPFPVFVGFCQYEPHILKITPPLSIRREEVHAVCETLIAVLKRPVHRLLPSLLGALLPAPIRTVSKARRSPQSVHEKGSDPLPVEGRRP